MTYPGHVPRIDGFQGAPIGAIYGAQPQSVYTWTAADDEHRRRQEAAEREAARVREAEAAKREAAWTVLVDRVHAEPDPQAQVLLAVALFTAGTAANGAVQVVSGPHLTRALPDLFRKTCHWLDPGRPSHAPWDSPAIARHFATRMIAQGGEPDRFTVRFASRGAFGRAKQVERLVDGWSFPGGLTDSETAVVNTEGTLQFPHLQDDDPSPRLNVVALRAMVRLLGGQR